PIQWALYHGEHETGITTMQMDVGMDSGPMLLKQVRPIGLLDNALEVAQDLAAMSADLLPPTLLQLNAGTLTPTPQNEANVTYAPLIQKKDYQLDWTKPALHLHNQVRGFYPNCNTLFRQKDLKIEATAPLGEGDWPQLPETLQSVQGIVADLPTENSIDSAPGTVVAIAKGIGPIVQTGDGCLLLRGVKPSGKKAQTGWDFANGNRLEVGEQLGK
ncbi:MAG: methionyl-tRNA formyltransferase, partial [Leptolyngbya sp. SIO1D8]|nr:methionyl-tRNA formyltransferase [Leptolyngbya sp. SIO1D8]